MDTRNILANVLALLTGRVSSYAGGATAALHRSLRLACALCFVGYGARGVLTTADWLPLFHLFAIPEWIAWPAMPVWGAIDLTVGLIVLLHPCRAVLVWMAGWSTLMALLLPLAGLSFWEVLDRAATFGPPVAYLLLSASQDLSWFEKIPVRPLAPAALLRLRWTLQGMLTLVFLGHGCLATFDAPPELFAHWRTLGVPIDTASVRWFGSIEILLGLTILFVVASPFLLGLFYWKLLTEGLVLVGGGFIAICQLLQRNGSFVMALALLCTAHLLAHPLAADKDQDYPSPRLGIEHALRVAFASFVFAAAIATAYAWMRIDVRTREQSFADYAQLVASGQQYAGWVPADLPTSARLIHEVHDLTTRTALATFHVSDPAEFLGYINKLHETATPEPCSPPLALLQPPPHWSAPLLQHRGDLQILGNDTHAYAYDGDTGQVFAWTCNRVSGSTPR